MLLRLANRDGVERILEVHHHKGDPAVAAMLRHEVDCVVNRVPDAREDDPLRSTNVLVDPPERR